MGRDRCLGLRHLEAARWSPGEWTVYLLHDRLLRGKETLHGAGYPGMDDNAAYLLAYIDPGSGSLLLQFLIAGLVGGGVFFRNQLVGMVSWIKSRAFSRKS